jgi:DNA-directed RNA polymerase subunit RPC12/RpoP
MKNSNPNPKCPECGGDILVGIAIKPELEYGARTLVPIPILNHKTMEIINVSKCKNCGYSYTEE